MTEVILIPYKVEKYIVWKDSVFVWETMRDYEFPKAEWVLKCPGKQMIPKQVCGDWMLYSDENVCYLTNGIINLRRRPFCLFNLVTHDGTMWAKARVDDKFTWLMQDLTDEKPRVTTTRPSEKDRKHLGSRNASSKPFRVGNKYGKFIIGEVSYLIVKESHADLTGIPDFDRMIGSYILPQFRGKVKHVFEEQ